jgi:hypothetical protein
MIHSIIYFTAPVPHHVIMGTFPSPLLVAYTIRVNDNSPKATYLYLRRGDVSLTWDSSDDREGFRYKQDSPVPVTEFTAILTAFSEAHEQLAKIFPGLPEEVRI